MLINIIEGKMSFTSKIDEWEHLRNPKRAILTAYWILVA